MKSYANFVLDPFWKQFAARFYEAKKYWNKQSHGIYRAEVSLQVYEVYDSIPARLFGVTLTVNPALTSYFDMNPFKENNKWST